MVTSIVVHLSPRAASCVTVGYGRVLVRMSKTILIGMSCNAEVRSGVHGQRRNLPLPAGVSLIWKSSATTPSLAMLTSLALEDNARNIPTGEDSLAYRATKARNDCALHGLSRNDVEAGRSLVSTNPQHIDRYIRRERDVTFIVQNRVGVSSPVGI